MIYSLGSAARNSLAFHFCSGWNAALYHIAVSYGNGFGCAGYRKQQKTNEEIKRKLRCQHAGIVSAN